jgi:hypothetical protein
MLLLEFCKFEGLLNIWRYCHCCIAWGAWGYLHASWFIVKTTCALGLGYVSQHSKVGF